jgi:hypothetical protein
MVVGDKVVYLFEDENGNIVDDGVIWTIEKDYGFNVFLIGNEEDFCDLVPASCLRIVENG